MTKHIIKNYSSLSKTKLRKDALDILESGLNAINTEKVVNEAVILKNNILYVNKKKFNLKKFNNIIVIGIGKASLEAAKVLEKKLGNKITKGIVLDVKKGNLKKIKSIAGTHPLPSMENVKATSKIECMIKNLSSKDLLISIISGGGSALLCSPYSIKCNDLKNVTKLLIKKGATIEELNTVRKHLSEIQGGQFAKLAYPATIISLIFSDVPGNDILMVASGPTVKDKSTKKDAAKILLKYDVMNKCKIPNCDLIETPKENKFFKKVSNILMVSNDVALKAMKVTSNDLGYKTIIHSNKLIGEANKTGRMLASLIKEKKVILAAGETTVNIKGKGNGGRNQELVLGALSSIKKDSLILSCASDGLDNTDHAGAIVDDLVKEYVKKNKIDYKKYLENNDSYNFFKKTNTYIKTGITGANVSDLMIVIKK